LLAGRNADAAESSVAFGGGLLQCAPTGLLFMHPSQSAGPRVPGVLTALVLLWLAGAAMRLPILAVPPVVRLIHDDLHMSETQVGLLIGIPLLMFALAAIPGSLLIARAGAGLIVVAGLLIAALASAGRAISFDLWTLYGMTVLMGFGIAIMQPAVPTLVRQWLPDRVAFGTAVSSNGLMVGVAAAPALSIPLVLPLVGQNWRLDLLVWSVPSLIAALLYLAVVVRTPAAPVTDAPPRLWWPDWRNPLIWLLGLTFGSNNAFYYSVNAFLPDYLNSAGRAEMIGPVLGWLNVSQLIASFVLMVAARRLHRRAVSYLVFGLLPAFGVLGIVLLDGVWVILAASVTGFSLAVTFVVTFALPPVLAKPDDVHRMAGGMFAIAFTIAVIVPVLCGALWDLTGVPWTVFLPAGVCAITLTVLGVVLTRRNPAQ
jgi:CP family cyanate transporter-like MFS transporter